MLKTLFSLALALLLFTALSSNSNAQILTIPDSIIENETVAIPDLDEILPDIYNNYFLTEDGLPDAAQLDSLKDELKKLQQRSKELSEKIKHSAKQYVDRFNLKNHPFQTPNFLDGNWPSIPPIPQIPRQIFPFMPQVPATPEPNFFGPRNSTPIPDFPGWNIKLLVDIAART